MKAFILILFIIGCSNIEFVHNTNQKNEILKSTSYTLSGSQKNIVVSELNKIIGKNDNNKFNLEINTVETITNEVVSSDSTTLKYKISHTMNYILREKKKGCIILEKKITTMTSYDSKSAGYNFGSDISKSKNTEININNNIKNFIKSTEIADLSKCLNES